MARRPARARKSAEKPAEKAAKKPAPKPTGGATGKTAEATEERIVDAALALAGERGWRTISLADIAEAAGMSLTALYTVLPSKGAILEAFARRIDRATLAGLEPAAESEDSVRDRLFELVKQGMSADEMLAARPTREYDERCGNPELFIRNAAKGMAAHARQINGVV